MQPAFIRLLRSKGLAVAVHAAFWVLLVVILIQLRGKAPEYQDVSSYSLPTLSPIPVSRLDSLFISEGKAPVLVTNLPSPFFTTAFLPAPKPPPPPPPPPPTTRKITVIYQGFFETAGGPRMAVLNTGSGIVAAPIGSQPLTNFFVLAAAMPSLTLTNTAGQTNVLLLNTPTDLEIPIK